MPPKFEEMTNAQLRAYALAHREEIEPLRVLFSRRTPDSEATWYGPLVTPEGVPIEENIRISEEAIRQRIAQIEEKRREQEMRENNGNKIEEDIVNSQRYKMTTVTTEEIEQFREQLVENSKVLADLEVIERCGGELERAARVLSRRADIEEVRAGANWQSGLQKAREIVCDGKFKDGLVPGLIGALIGTLTASGSPILVAVATPMAIYITKVGIEAFCKDPQSTSEDKENPS